MTRASRRAVLGLLAATAPYVLLERMANSKAHADEWGSNTELYAHTTEGLDYARRYHRDAEARTVILAPHGGGIEPGTSELCLAIAGFDPATLTGVTGAPRYDYWMFEGIRNQNNSALHITSTNCDDPVALSLVRSMEHAVGIHGCSPSAAGAGYGEEAVLVGGADAALRGLLVGELTRQGFDAVDASNHPKLSGTHPDNISNRTTTGAGAQLEIMTKLRGRMFTDNTRAGRKTSTTPVFTQFVAAVRAALQA